MTLDPDFLAYADELDRRRRVLAVERERVDTANRLANVAAVHPDISPDVALAVAEGGYDWNTLPTEIAEDQAKHGSGGFGFLGSVYQVGGKAVSKGFEVAADIADFATPEPVEDVLGGASTALKGATRVGMTALETPFQEVANVIRAGGYAGVRFKQGDTDWFGNFGEVLSGSTSSGRAAVGDLLSGERVELGSGFMAGGQIAEEAKRRNEQYLIDGAPISVGRVTANRVFEQGSTAYNVLSGTLDAAVALSADPVGIGLTKLGQANRARKTFAAVEDETRLGRAAEWFGSRLGVDHSDAGMVNGVRQTFLPEKVEAWFADPKARRLFDELAAEPDFATIWGSLGGPAGKIDWRTALELTEASSTDEVVEVYRRAIHGGLRDKPHLARSGATIVPRAERSILWEHMPKPSINPKDPDDVLVQLDRWMANAKLPMTQRDVSLRKIADAAAAAPEGRVAPAMYDAVFSVVDDAYQHLLSTHGPIDARRLTRSWREDVEAFRNYLVTEVGVGTEVPGVVRSQFDPTRIIDPALPTQYLNNNIPLPDARAIRRAVSRYRKVLESGAWEKSDALASFLQNELWKPMQLIRGAWTVRVVGEEQVRMAVSGKDSIFAHPLSAILWAMGRRGAVDVAGEGFDAAGDLDEYTQALSGGVSRLLDDMPSSLIRTKHKPPVAKGEEGYVNAWAEMLARVADDPITRTIIHDGPEAAKEWATNGAGQRFIADMLGQPRNAAFREPGGVDRYVDFFAGFVREQVGDLDDILDVVRTGYLPDGARAIVKGRSTREFRRWLSAYAEEFGPAREPGDLFARLGKGHAAVEYYDRAVRKMFSVLGEKPTNFLSRSPMFRQSYWQRIRELLPNMDAQTQQAVLDAARDANLGDRYLGRMRKAIARHGASPDGLGLEDADRIAKSFGLDATRKLLYDLSERRQLFDIARHIFPFGEAWAEVLSRWAMIGQDQPQVIRNFQRGLTAGRQAGFFYNDPTTGEEVFAMPFTEQINKTLLGVPIPMVGRIQGLSLVSEVWPSVGPLVQIPAALILPDTPDWDTFRELIFPFGEPDTAAGVESLLPAWVQKWQTAFGQIRTPEQQRQFTNTVSDVARYLASTGEYDLQGADAAVEIARLIDDAKDKAKGLYILRGVAQFGSPTSPLPRVQVYDKEGRLHLIQKLVNEYRDLEKVDYEHATAAFLNKYGLEALLLLGDKSKGVFPPTDKVDDWIRANPAVAERYPDVAGFFAPQDGEYDPTSYQRQIRAGTRQALDTNELVAQANHRVAMLIWRNARDQVGDRPSDAQSAWLYRLREALMRDYPGFEPFPHDQNRVPVMVTQIEAALEEPAVAESDAGQAARVYLQARSQAQQAADTTPGITTFTRAKALAPIRVWLRRLAAALIDEHPDFRPLWEAVFERELARDEEVALVA